MTTLPRDDATAPEIDLLARQLERMRGMLFEYSRLFFTHMRTWTIVVLGILVASLFDPLGGAVLIVPFLVPFVFMEASYLFWYTVFARRHAEWLERSLAVRLGRAVPAAHRLEAAFFYSPDEPKVAAFALRRPLSHMSVVTVAYSAGAGLLWLSSLVLSIAWIGDQADAQPLLWLVPVAAVAWTVAIAGYLVWTWLRRPDEDRLVAALDEVYPEAALAQPGQADSDQVRPAPGR